MSAGDGAGRQRGRSERDTPGPVGSAARLGERLLNGVDRLGRPATRASAQARTDRLVRTPVLTVVTLIGVLATLGGSVAVISLIIGGVRAGAQPAAVSTPRPTGRTVTESMKVLTGAMDGKPGWPKFTNESWTVHKGDTVVLRITNYDDGPAPLSGEQAQLSAVRGTVDGTETVNGKTMTSMSPADVSHTFTVIGLGLNVPIPPAPSGGSVTVVARFVAGRTGSFVWQCYAPCGTGPNFTGGAMSVSGWMTGEVRVAS